MGRLTGCLVWILALLVILLVLSILFGGFQRGTKVGGQGRQTAGDEQRQLSGRVMKVPFGFGR